MAGSTERARIHQGLESGTGYVREQLLDRRRRLAAIPSSGVPLDARGLLRDVDSALARLDTGEYGVCGGCHDPVEPQRLLSDPLTPVCLGCLSEEQQRALEYDLELASVVQGAMLPAERVLDPGWEIEHRYRPLGPVSGDYCDVLPARGSQSTTHFVLGDVSGKGVSASILMAHLQAVFRALVPLDLPLTTLIERANRIFSEGTLSSSYATLLLGRLSRGGRLEICNAGHCPPLLVRRGELTPLPATGLPLGLFSRSSFQVTTLDLAQGDALFLYTDGLTEATDGEGRAFGIERVEAIARGLNDGPATTTLERCLHDAETHRRGAPREDDLTLMTVRRTAEED